MVGRKPRETPRWAKRIRRDPNRYHHTWVAWAMSFDRREKQKKKGAVKAKKKATKAKRNERGR